MEVPISGRGSHWRKRIQLIRIRLRRHDFTVLVSVALATLFMLLFAASIDFFHAIKFKDDQLQAVGLRNQLVEFLLSTTREPDGSSPLDNPDDFAQLRRPLKVATVQRPFFSYFLTKENAKNFNKDLARIEQPRACVLEYPVDFDEARQGSPNTLQVCLTAVQDDPYGRYVYAIIKYPIRQLRAHQRGRPLKGSDLVQLRFKPEYGSPITLNLALESPRLPSEARRRNPARFEGLYDVAGFLNADGSRPTSLVNGQALERLEQPDGQRFVTLAIRIDSTILAPRIGAWPEPALKKMLIDLEIRRAGSPLIVVQDTQKGSAQVSLAQAYLTSVPSGAVLNIYNGDSSGELYWSSKSLEASSQESSSGLMQFIGSKLADLLKGEELRAEQTVQSPVSGQLFAEVRTSGSVISDVAARVLALLMVAGVLVLFLALVILYVAKSLGQISGDAIKVARRKHGDVWSKYKKRRDQIGTIGRAIRYLDRRIRAVAERKEQTLIREKEAIAQHTLNLHLISHEISSPLATLLEMNKDEGENKRLLEKMGRAVSIFSAMRDVEAMKKEARPAVYDLAAWLSDYANNMSTDELQLTYIGPLSGVRARYDDILLDLVLHNLVNNARRYALMGTNVELRLTSHDSRQVEFEVFNQGPNAASLDKIFLCGVTESESPDNSGFGLYTAKQYVDGFSGSIHAENRDNGFAVVVRLESGSHRD